MTISDKSLRYGRCLLEYKECSENLKRIVREQTLLEGELTLAEKEFAIEWAAAQETGV